MFDEQGRTVYKGQEALDHFAEALGSRLRETRKLHYHTTFQNLPISIENRKGSVRKGVDDDGSEWKTKMRHPYGYIRGTEGPDGDGVDVFVGPNEDAAYAYVVHCNDPESGDFDEDKVMLGFNSSQRAKEVFLQHYDDPKFFGGIASIPMWKFSEKVFVKKNTVKKLVASMRESIPAHVGATGLDQSMKKAMLGHHQDQMLNPEVREAASLQLPEDMLEHGVRGQKWGVRRQPNYKSLPGYVGNLNQLKRIEPQEKEGQREGWWISTSGDVTAIVGSSTHMGYVSSHPEAFGLPKSEKGTMFDDKETRSIMQDNIRVYPVKGALHFELADAKEQNLRLMQDFVSKADWPAKRVSFDMGRSTNALKREYFDMPKSRFVRLNSISQARFLKSRGRLEQESKAWAFHEAEEHGVKGMKWGIRHVRKDVGRPGARGGRSPKSAHGHQAVQKNKPIQKRDLANDPRTMSMMSATHGTLKALNDLEAKQHAAARQAQQQGEPPKSNTQHHGEALEALKGLGWTILKSFARMAGLGGAADMISSVVRSPSGQKAHLQTDRKTGKHSLATDRPLRRRREARIFESRMGSFLQESRRSRGIYYAREMGRYGTDAEDDDLDTIREAFEGDRVDFSRTKRHAELGMGYFHEKIDRAKAVVIKPTRGKRLTTGVYSEARHAIKKGIPVYALRKGKLRRVKSVEVLESNNKEGHFGRIRYRKKSRWK